MPPELAVAQVARPVHGKRKESGEYTEWRVEYGERREVPKADQMKQNAVRLNDVLRIGILLNERRSDEDRYLNYGMRPTRILDKHIARSAMLAFGCASHSLYISMYNMQ